MSGKVTLEMVYREIRLVRERLDALEDLIEALIIRELPEVELSPEELKDVKRRVEEMKRGEYTTLEELKTG